ncbi:MAG TPA: 3-phosphoshikimate 1-carboxyvinyltransferase, partial [Microbacterium sp.]|nr:3-phosphoshikimate 1-carboxyvinyltransferase [Microbacterium sp.]
MSGERYSTPTGLGESGWSAPRASGALTARLAVPGSKSLTNRELILSAIADSPSTLHAPLHSDDSVRMVAALTALGIQIESVEGESPFGPDLIVTPPSGSGSVGASSSGLRGATVDCGQAGTVMRFIAGIAGLAEGDVTLTAHESALHRPMGAMITALRDVGVDVDDEGRWALPFQVRGHGHIRGGEVVIDASASSQFVSGMLLAAPRFDTGLHLIHSGSRLPSMPHIDMTIEC